MKKQSLQIDISEISESHFSPKQIFDLFDQTGMMLYKPLPKRIIAIDPGNAISGFCMIQDGQISFAANLPNQFVIPKIREFCKNSHYTVVIEDVRPYGVRLTQQLLDTTKFIGELQWRLMSLKIVPEMRPRFEVKKWVFDHFGWMIIPLIEAKMAKKGAVKQDGEPKAPHFMWVDDAMVVRAMKDLWEIPAPERGYGYKHGLKDHSWQALALGSMILEKNKKPR
jgi:hypothetical protein